LLIAAVEAPPVPSRQSEHVNVRLVQLDVAIDTSRMTPLRALTASDLELSVDGREITDFYLDSTCTPSRGTEQPTAGESAGEPPAPALQRTAIVFFFDQAHLTLGGRELAIELAKSLVSRLIVHGARGSLVSSGSQLQTIVPLTDDPSKLIAGIDAMRNDTRLFDSYGMTEGRRVDEVVWLRQADEEMARMCARMYAREEVSKARETQGQLVVTLDGLAEVTGEELTPSAAAEIDAIVNAGIARGVHLFTVQAQGLTAPRPPGNGNTETERVSTAEDTLVALAVQTGGEAFLHTGLDRIVAGIQARVACPFVLSFPPGDLPRDKSLSVDLSSRVPGVTVASQDRIVVPSDGALLAARLNAAFVNPAADRSGGLHVVLVPRAGDGESWRALIQVRLDTDTQHRVGVDLGATVIQRDQVIDSFNRSIATSGSARPLVMERTVTLRDAPVRIVAVAYDREANKIGSAESRVAWPRAVEKGAAIAPIAVLQSRNAAVAHDQPVGPEGAIALDSSELLDPSQVTALESVICRGSGITAPLVVERYVEGLAGEPFAPMTIEADGAPCIQTVDVLKPGTLAGPLMDYRIIVRNGNEIVADQRKPLRLLAK
jgi:hypothetical protein